MTALDPEGRLAPARVAQEHKGGYRVLCAAGELAAELAGHLRYTAAGLEDLPGVGDWVAVAPRAREGLAGEMRATIRHVLPRKTWLIRKAPDQPARSQLLAASIESVFVMSSANQDFSPHRIERILAVVREGGADAVVVLSKLDVAEGLDAKLEQARAVAPDTAVLALSAVSGEGLDGLAPFLKERSSVALIGSSGVGKSTLVNRLLGEERMATKAIREADDKGRHATTHRELVPLPCGAVLIDTPGLREVGLWADERGVDAAFPEIEALLEQCRFNDCTHETEPGCALISALDSDELDPARYASYLKLKRETSYLVRKRDPYARHEQRQKRKKFTKAIRRRPDKRGPRR